MDLISRADAIDALNDVVTITGLTNATAFQDYIRRVSNRLHELSSVQPEIIRCKDCEDYQTDWETSYPNRHYCATMDAMMPEDGFCSNAERREESE